MTPISRASSRRGFFGLATIAVNAGPSARSTARRIATTCTAPVRYQPGQRYQPRKSPPRIRVSAAALPNRCRPKALRRNLMRLIVVLALHAVRDRGLPGRLTLPGNRALLTQPGTEIDQPAALAAERPCRRRAPIELAAAGRALDACGTHARPQLQQLSVNGTSAWVWVGRVVSPFQVRKRTLQRWWLPLISG